MNCLQRINWIDWSKVFAIYLVALGHLVQRTDIEIYIYYFIYLFHMLFFFFISGYLFKMKEENFKLFFIHSFRLLVIPYLLLNLIGNIFLILTWILSKQWPNEQIIYFLTADGRGAIGLTWFLFCLFWAHLLADFIIKNIINKIIFTLACSLISYILPNFLFGRLDATLMAIPFFIVGFMLRKRINFSLLQSCILFLLFFVIISLSTLFMGEVSIYARFFHNYPLLYYPCAFSGIMTLISLSSILSRYFPKLIETLSRGTIVIMVFYGLIFLYVTAFFKHLFSLDFVFLHPLGEMVVSRLIFVVIILSYYLVSKLSPYCYRKSKINWDSDCYN